VSATLVVVGDVLLDVDTLGRVDRVSPDAPVPVLEVEREVPRPGGAGLAAALAARDGAEVVLVSAVADDEPGRRLTQLLAAAGVRLVPVPHDGSTPVKRRLRADGQSLLRLDSGAGGSVGAAPAEALDAIGTASAVLVSDYGRGLTTRDDVRSALAVAARRVPVVWDPHPRGASPVPGARLVTPNRAEAAGFAEQLGHDDDGLDGLARLSAQAAALTGAWRAHAVAVTLGARGALLSRGESSPTVIPSPPVDAPDPCGAGDRFASAAALALAGGAVTLEAVQTAVRAAAAFVADGGAAAFGEDQGRGPEPAGLDRVARVRASGGTVVATGGCFDLLHAGHVGTLEAARALGDCLVVCLNSDDSVRRLKGASRPLVPQADRARVLEALEPVDAVVVFDEDTPVEVLGTIRPDVWVKGGDYTGAELPEATLLREWGGQSVVLPYLEGRSTSRLVEAAERTRAAR
jgi:rfaE bifunctional protein nucleotidyltransferase chain/domain/rfaE bifunctional protein kinase chain/domain